MAENKQRDELVFLDDIIESIERKADYVQDITADRFESNIEKQDAVIRRI